MKYTTLPYPMPKLNLYPYILFHFKKVSFLSFTKKINFFATNYGLSSKAT